MLGSFLVDEPLDAHVRPLCDLDEMLDAPISAGLIPLGDRPLPDSDETRCCCLGCIETSLLQGFPDP